MTDKRFFIFIDEGDVSMIRDTTGQIKDIYGHYKYDDLDEICDELNRLVDSNRYLNYTLEHFYNLSKKYNISFEKLCGAFGELLEDEMLIEEILG